MPDSTPAVFLSYASQDAEAARRIAEALRASGVEVWFDEAELVGGDAWDAKIRKQIQSCTLFVPIISANTQARSEGYFRLEWKLAVDRSHLMADDRPFLFPVVIDDTPDTEARVPDRFRERQWTLLGSRDTVEGFTRILSAAVSGEFKPSAATGATASPAHRAPAHRPRPHRGWLAFGISIGVLGLVFAFILALTQGWFRPGGPISSARGLAYQAGDTAARPTQNYDELMHAADQCERALALDDSDAHVWAIAAGVDAALVGHGYDHSFQRRQSAEQKVARAQALAPDAFETRHALADVLAQVARTPEATNEAIDLYRELAAERPTYQSLLTKFGTVLRNAGRFNEAAAVFEENRDQVSLGWNDYMAQNYDRALGIANALLAQNIHGPALLLKSHNELLGFEDATAVQSTVFRFSSAELQAEDTVWIAVMSAFQQRNPERVIRLLENYPRDFYAFNGFLLPKQFSVGQAHEAAGRPDAAQAEWQAALQLVREHTARTPDNPIMIGSEAMLLAALGKSDDAARVLDRYRSLRIDRHDQALDLVEAFVLIRLNRHEEILAEIARVLREKPTPWWRVAHANVRFNSIFDPLREDPRLEALLRETLPAGAKPFAGPARN